MKYKFETDDKIEKIKALKKRKSLYYETILCKLIM